MIITILLRRYRLMIGSWLVLLMALAGGTVSAYQSTYQTPAQRLIAVQLNQHNVATTLLYGQLSDPGTPAQMFAWEIGAIATILAAVMGVLVAVAVTREAEDDGTLELVRSCGVDPRGPLRAAFGLLVLVSALITLGCAVVDGAWVGRVDGVTWPGAVTFGGVVGLTFLLVAMTTVVLAQVGPTAVAARSLGFAAVGVAFILRAVADTRHVGGLNWLTPLGLRAIIRPFDGDRWPVLAAALMVIAVLARLAEVLSGHREYRGGLLPRGSGSAARLEVGSAVGFALRLARRSILAWTAAVGTIGALFTALGSGVVQQARSADLGGFLGTQLGTRDPVSGYFAYVGTVLGLVVCAYAVLCVLGYRQNELAGRTDQILTTGLRRWAPLAAQTAVAALGSACVLLAAGTLTALIAPLVIDGPDVAAQAFFYVVSQWPAALAVAGWTALLLGLRPQLAWLAWVPLIVSGVLALLGQLLDISQGVRDLGLFQHTPDVASASTGIGDLLGLLVLVAVAVLACLVALAGVTRRDVSAG
ncbi:MAG: hypothetical protein ABI890_04065 [Lapillicoccus sp.]